MLALGLWVGLGALLLLGSVHEGRRVRAGKRPGIFHDTLRNLGASFRGGMLALHVGAIVATALLVLAGWDATLQSFFQRVDPLGFAFPFACLVGGNLWHALTGAAILAIGKLRGDIRLLGAGAAGLQALLLAAFVNLGAKIVSGRSGPLPAYRPEWMPSRFAHSADPGDFRFDFWNHLEGGRWFWPSGHTATAVAFVSALVAVYPEKPWVAWVGYPLAAMMGLAMVDGDFHWASDVVAGALMGHAAGWAVGRSFRRP
jgi:membrane-associated phospholipid phosphatase